MRTLFVAALVAFATAASAAPAYRLPSSAVPDRYAITFAPNLASGTFGGHETITVRLLAATSTITLNAVDLRVRDASARIGQSHLAARVSYQPAAQTMVLAFAHPLAPGTVELRLAFDGRLSHELRGLYAAEADGRRYAFTQFEATDARRAFPCFDEPADKARFDVTAIIGSELTAVSNGRIVSERVDSATHKKTVHFAETPRMSSYLLALAVGPLVSIEGHAGAIPVRVYTRPGKLELARYALAAATAFLPRLGGYFGIGYPFGKLDLVAVPDFAAGAMENSGAIFFRETDLLLDPARASASARRRVASVIAHEMAHQWFGDLVTMRWWDDLWLNEAFATWMQVKVVDGWQPAWHMRDDFAIEEARVLFHDALASTHPIHVPVRTAADANEAFDDITYDKGASVLRMLEQWLGEKTFQAGIHAYLTAHAHGNTTAADLWSALGQVSGKPVAKVAQSWFTQAGHPLLSVAASCKGAAAGTVILTQLRDGASPPGAAAERWLIPLFLHTARADRTELFDAARARVAAPAGCAAWLDANGDGNGFYRVRYDGAAAQAIARALPHLKVPERIGLVADGWAQVQSGKEPISQWLELTTDLDGERSRQVLEALAIGWGQIDQHLIHAGQRPDFARMIQSTLAPALAAVGYQPKPKDTDEERLARASLLHALAYLARSPEARQVVTADLKAYLADPRALAPTLADVVVPLAARDGDAALYAQYLAHLRAARTPVERNRFLMALAAFESPALIERTLTFALSSEVRTQDVTHLIAAEFVHPHRQVAWAFIKAHWPLLRARVPGYGLSRVVRATGGFCSKAHADDVASFFADPAHRAPAARRSLAQAVESIRQCAQLKATQSTLLAGWLKGAEADGRVPPHGAPAGSR